MSAKRQRPARIGLDRGTVLGEGNDRPAAEKRYKTHAIKAGAGRIGMDAEEIQGLPSKGVCLGGPVRQEPERVLPEDLPARLGPGRMRRHGEQIGDALNPFGGHAVGRLKQDGMAARRTQRHTPDRAYFVNFVTLTRRTYFVNFVDFVTLPSQNQAFGMFLPLRGRNGLFSAVSCGFHVPGKVKIASHLSEP